MSERRLKTSQYTEAHVISLEEQLARARAALEETNRGWHDCRRSLAASRALVEAKDKALEEAEALGVDHAHGGVCETCNDWASRLADITGAALARTEADFSMDEETARIYKEGLIAKHDERHPDGD